MLLFITGLFVGSFAMFLIMSLMQAAKKGDQIDAYFNEKTC